MTETNTRNQNAWSNNQFLREQTIFLFQNSTTAVAVNISIASLTYIAIPIPQRAWLASVIAVSALRLLFTLYYSKKLIAIRNVRVIYNSFLVMVALQGAAWGISSVFLYMNGSEVQKFYLIAIVCGMSGGSILTLASSFSAFACFTIPAVLPLVLKLLLSPQTAFIQAGFMGIIFIIAVLLMTKRINHFIIKLIRTNKDLDLVANELGRHKTHLEEKVAERTRSYENINRQLEKEIRKRAAINDQLEFVAKQWRTTFDTITDFVSVHDQDLKYIRVNKALADFVGEEPRNLVGRYCYEVMHGLKDHCANCPQRTALNESGSVIFEVYDKDADIPLIVTCTPLFHDDGSLLGSVHVARDISEEKKAREQREQLIRKLEDSLGKVKLLSGLIPICASCKKIRDEKGYWQQVESYIHDHSEAEFSHGICPECGKKLYPDLFDDQD
ncbi:MAG TPA: PAS domain-containing protein [Desulfopila sp.]|nr:PAS domain-containing protein [Desulfopila sp.]